jgi:hypothetical protein
MHQFNLFKLFNFGLYLGFTLTYFYHFFIQNIHVEEFILLLFFFKDLFQAF